jgi:large subunit ribosomal protein L30
MAAAKKTVTIIQKGSFSGQKPGVRETLLGLGLGRRHSRRTLEDTPAVRGMISRVRHLIDVEGEAAKKTGT